MTIDEIIERGLPHRMRRPDPAPARPPPPTEVEPVLESVIFRYRDIRYSFTPVQHANP